MVIAEPISATHDTDERTNLEGIAPPTPVIGVATDFKTLLVLKGQKQDRFVLHHYRLAKPDVPLINGPQLVAFGQTGIRRTCFSSCANAMAGSRPLMAKPIQAYFP